MSDSAPHGMPPTQQGDVPTTPRPANPAPLAGTELPRTTRRRFLLWSGVAAGGAAIAGGAGYGGWQAWEHLHRRAAESPLAPKDRVLVIVTLYGGNDGLNTVIPAADPAYQQARPELAYKPEEVLDLGSGLGLSPGMKEMKALWDAKRMAIVRGVGYPEPDHSHFRSMAIWQTADPKRPQPSGWLGRWLDTRNDPLQAMSLELELPPLLAGEKLTGVTCPPSGLPIGSPDLRAALTMLGSADQADAPMVSEAVRAYADLTKAITTVGPAVDRQKELDEQEPKDPMAGTRTGGANGLHAQLELAATMIEMGLPTRVYSASLAGFDTHAGEKDAQERLLSQLDTALGDFQRRIDAAGKTDQVVTVVYSEFGRRVQANASDGTDHGTAGPMFVLGGGIAPGFHGDQPSLTDLDNGDLKATVDFRTVYANLLHKGLGADPGRFLGGWTKELDLLR